MTEKQTLSNKVVKSSLWLVMFQVFDNVLGLVRLIVLARLLSPAAFGLVGIAWLVLQIISAFTQTGIQAALIQIKDIDNKLNAAWSYLVLRGVILYSLVFVTAPWMASFFNSPESSNIIRVISLTLLFEGFTNIGVVLFQKDFEFHKHFIQQIAGNVLDAAIAIIAAFIFKNVWAIVYGAVIGSFVKCLLSYILSPYKPKFDFDLQKIKEMSNFGKWIFGSNILQFMYSQGDDLLVGKVLGTLYLGYYQLAYKISNLPATQITHIISTVLFPAYSKIQHEKNKLREVYITSLQLTSFLSFFLGTLIIYFTHDFILLFLGEQWLPIQLPMQILTVWGILRSIGSTTGPLWHSLGKPKIVTQLQFLQTVLFLITIYPLTQMYGITGTSLSIVFAALIPNIIAMYLVARTLNTRYSAVVLSLLYPFIFSCVVAVNYYVLKSTLFTSTTFVQFTLEASIIIAVFIGISLLCSKFFKYKLYRNVLLVMDEFPVPSAIKTKIRILLNPFA